MRRRFGLVLGMTLSLALGSTTAGAVTFNVNSSTDLPDRDINDTVCEATFNTGDCTVRAAVMEANAQAGADIIQLQGGTTDLTQPGSPSDSESIGDLDITDDLTILGINPTTRSRLDGGGNVLNDRLLDIRAGATVVIEDVVLQGGKVGGSGGAILIDGSALVTLINSQILGNRATGVGGGIWVGGGSTLDVQESLVSDNVASGGAGGIGCTSSTVDVTNSTISNNSGGAGGGVGVEAACAVTMDGSTVSGNSTTSTFWGGQGGGILVKANAIAVLTNSTVSGNTSISTGGGIYTHSPYGWFIAYASLKNTTVAFNHAATAGGGTYAASSAGGIDVENSIIAANTAATGPDCGGSGIDSVGYSLIGDTTGCTITGTTTGNVTNQSAELSSTLDFNDANTGVTAPTRTHALLPGSPAINAGNNATCEATDQRGVTRPIPSGGNCDMGAFEAPRCGDGVLNPPETCDDGNTSNGDSCNSSCQQDPPPQPGHNEPTVTAVTNGGLVVAYKDCESPFLPTTLSGPPACIPVQSDSVCYFQSVSGARGDYMIRSIATSGGRMLVEVDLAKLVSGCNGQTLRVKMALNETVEDCGTGGTGSCTVETRELDENDLALVSPSCVVASNTCTIRAELNNSASWPLVANSNRTGIEFRRFKVVRDVTGGTVDSFVPGVYLP